MMIAIYTLQSAHRLVQLQKRDLASTVAPTACAEVVFPLCATFVVCFRFWLRRKFKITFSWDDWCIAAAQPFFWALWAAWFYSSVFIVKTRISDLKDAERVNYLKWTFALFQPYNLATFLIKMSALFLYFRALASGVSTKPRHILYGMFVLNIALVITRITASMSFCYPASNFWNHPERCSPAFNSWAISVESISLGYEIALLIFPIPIIWNMRAADLRAKLTIYCAFALAGLILFCHAARIVLLSITPYSVSASLKDSLLPTMSLLSFVEIFLGTCCVSLPALYKPLRLWLGLLRESKPNHSDGLISESSKQMITPTLKEKQEVASVTALPVTLDDFGDEANSRSGRHAQSSC